LEEGRERVEESDLLRKEESQRASEISERSKKESAGVRSLEETRKRVQE